MAATLRASRFWWTFLKNVKTRNMKSVSTAADSNKYENEIHEQDRFENLLYDTHVPTSAFQKILLAVGSGSMSLYSPYRDDMIAVFGETTGFNALKNMREKMIASSEGRQILEDKPRLNSETIDLNYLRTLPENTFGSAYIKFLDDNKVSPDTRLPVQFIDDAELAYVMQRYREVHDLVHTLLDMPTNMLGEVAVKWVEAIQTGLPMCSLAALFGPIRFAKLQRKNYYTQVLPWAIRCGYQSSFLLNIYFEKRWEQSVEDIRNEMKIESPPKIPRKKIK